ncbi:hypothetical protein CVT24_007467 [Panaeolus cyanescens]|uniref:ATP-dependent DNA helicase n=1 Tax=Panaeolus cyanescens TaxID=181874 RepID=A0A409YR27_9AGAR|nr:hypothetical protein CVT24_007467 [Panaeolus cyanescens]
MSNTWAIGPISDPKLKWGAVRNGHRHECPHCHILLLTGERPGFCCGKGGSRLNDVPSLPPLPPQYNVFINDPRISSLSRVLNLVFSFASLETTHAFPTISGGPSFVAIQGKVYHRIRPDHQNSAVRWFLHDGYMQTASPHNNWASVLPDNWKAAFIAALQSVNPFVEKLRNLSGISTVTPAAHLILYDSGTTSEIAAIMCYDNTTQAQLSPRSLTISKFHGSNQRIPTVSRMWEPLAYPLFFPHATLGWGIPDEAVTMDNVILEDNDTTTTTQMWHYRARLLREPRFRIFGRLTNKYVVDMFSRDLESRLAYIRKNQLRIQAEDAELMGDPDLPPSENIYLPSTFLGSRRPDTSTFRISSTPGTAAEPVVINEIEDFWKGRYLSAGEATHRILGFHITKKDPAVTVLPIHAESSTRRQQYARRDGSHSSLSLLHRYFLRPSGSFLFDGIERSFASLSYLDYFRYFCLIPYSVPSLANPRHFAEQPNTCESPRMIAVLRSIDKPHITRIQSLKPSDGDIFYLRCILLNQPVKSFLDARTVENVVYDTFQDAATRLGLFSETGEGELTIIEAIATLRTPRQIRILFVDLLVNNDIIAPLDIWNQYQHPLLQDYYLQNQNTLDIAITACLQDLASLLQHHGKSLTDYGLPQPDLADIIPMMELRRWQGRETELMDRAQTQYSRFNQGQKALFDLIWNAVSEQQSLLLFVDGQAGTGKTTVIKAICDALRATEHIVLPTATSAFASLLYDGGQTTHSTFKDPEYAAFVNGVGDGAGPLIDLRLLPKALSQNDLINFVFPQDILQDPTQCLRRNILAPTNAQIDSFNDEILQRLTGASRLYLAADSLKESDNADMLPPEAIMDYVYQHSPDGMPPAQLLIKVGGVYRMMRNFSLDRGL